MKIIELLLYILLLASNEKERTQLQEVQYSQEFYECITTTMPITAETPLRGYEKEICEASEETGIDYMLVLAISVVESNLCTNTNFQYNCWSVDVYNREYTGYRNSIDDIFGTLVRYKERGLETVEEIGNTYCPNIPEYPHQADDWIRKVNNYLSRANR